MPLCLRGQSCMPKHKGLNQSCRQQCWRNPFMRRPGEWQNEFASALINPYMPVPPGLTDPLGEPAPPRFGVYRNNVVRGLVEALKDKFPVACRIVGADCFEAMARAYALQNPPRSPILLEYGAGFAEFIERFEPVAS